ncbi:hypothetical protein C0995_015820 [Termitomyces sp. Mi166|nr:hypothetical protein C0995_015820 [Termitomyces sp. Mi166\
MSENIVLNVLREEFLLTMSYVLRSTLYVALTQLCYQPATPPATAASASATAALSKVPSLLYKSHDS